MGVFFFFKQKTAYEMRISDWSSDVCSSDLQPPRRGIFRQYMDVEHAQPLGMAMDEQRRGHHPREPPPLKFVEHRDRKFANGSIVPVPHRMNCADRRPPRAVAADRRSEEHPSELQSLMRISYAVFFLKK